MQKGLHTSGYVQDSKTSFFTRNWNVGGILTAKQRLIFQRRYSNQVKGNKEFARIHLLVPELFFCLILAHPVYKMWIIQEPNMLEL